MELVVAPNWNSVVIFLDVEHVYGAKYRMFRAEGDSIDYRDVTWARLNFNTWDDVTVGEGRTYFYKAVAYRDDQRVGCSPAMPITVRFPGYALLQIEEAYNTRNLNLIEQILSDDHRTDGFIRDCERVSCGKETEIAIHRKMFNPDEYETGLDSLWLDIKKINLRRTTEEEDYLGFLCFEADAKYEMYISFNSGRQAERAPVRHFRRRAIFRIKHSREDPTQWVIYRWTDESLGAFGL
jgi:hypothetical protein